MENGERNGEKKKKVSGGCRGMREREWEEKEKINKYINKKIIIIIIIIITIKLKLKIKN